MLHLHPFASCKSASELHQELPLSRDRRHALWSLEASHAMGLHKQCGWLGHQVRVFPRFSLPVKARRFSLQVCSADLFLRAKVWWRADCPGGERFHFGQVPINCIPLNANLASNFLNFIHCLKRVVLFSLKVGFKVLPLEAKDTGEVLTVFAFFVMVDREDHSRGWWFQSANDGRWTFRHFQNFNARRPLENWRLNWALWVWGCDWTERPNHGAGAVPVTCVYFKIPWFVIIFRWQMMTITYHKTIESIYLRSWDKAAFALLQYIRIAIAGLELCQGVWMHQSTPDGTSSSVWSPDCGPPAKGKVSQVRVVLISDVATPQNDQHPSFLAQMWSMLILINLYQSYGSSGTLMLSHVEHVEPYPKKLQLAARQVARFWLKMGSWLRLLPRFKFDILWPVLLGFIMFYRL